MDSPATGPLAWLKKLRGSSGAGSKAGAGAQQMAMLRRLPHLLRLIPGKAQDVRAYFLCMQYWLAGSDENIAAMVAFLVDRYADGPRSALRGTLAVASPAVYPENGLYHPKLPDRLTAQKSELPRRSRAKGTVGVLVMRSYVLAGNTAHYDGVIAALEQRGLNVVPAFASGLDARPAVDRYFRHRGKTTVDAVLSLTGFSLVGGPAYNDATAAEELLAELDVPYLSALAVEFQSHEQWQASEQGLTPVEATMMVAIPELDGATSPMVFGGRAAEGRDMVADEAQVERLADRVARLVALRKRPVSERRVGVVLFNFPPNAGSVGSAAFLAVFESLWNVLKALADEGYTVDVPESVDALRTAILEGNAARFGTDANVAERLSVDAHVKGEPHLAELEAQWGPAPGRHNTDGSALFVLGKHFGNVFVGVQPAFGYEGDPMRLLFEGSFAPTHAFSAFYRYLREGFGADVLLHFGTHGALEFMPGKQVGLGAGCWPERLLGAVPNVYLYASNNPSEGTIAKRRSAATLVSYLTPSLARSGLYRGLLELKDAINRWRCLEPDAATDRDSLSELIQAQAAELDLVVPEPQWNGSSAREIEKLHHRVLEIEETLIPDGLHVVGATPSETARTEVLGAIAETTLGVRVPEGAVAQLADGGSAQQLFADVELAAEHTDRREQLLSSLEQAARHLGEDSEVDGLLRALEGRYVRPAPGGDLLRTPEVLPTGRNLHGFDPFRMPSVFSVRDGARQAQLLLDRLTEDGGSLPESIAMVLWGTDNLKSEGGPIGQALALLGARPRFDSYGRLCGAELIDLETLGRPRIDVVLTLSGIFRDLLPLQTRLLAEAALLASQADEPLTMNFVRRHTLTYQNRLGCDFETAALRVFSNAEHAYGANVNHLVDSGRWEEEDELANAYTQRKSFAYGVTGGAQRQSELLGQLLGNVSATYQNLESVELGVTSVDHYFDSLGGISRAVSQACGKTVPVYIGDQTRGRDQVRALADQVALETRTRMLNPRWYEGMLEHGYEGVRSIEEHVTNTMGWSATTGQVDPWIYQKLTQTFVLDEEMRNRLAELNPTASVRVADRLLEACERDYWQPDAETLAALEGAREQLEDKLEGVAA